MSTVILIGIATLVLQLANIVLFVVMRRRYAATFEQAMKEIDQADVTLRQTACGSDDHEFAGLWKTLQIENLEQSAATYARRAKFNNASLVLVPVLGIIAILAFS